MVTYNPPARVDATTFRLTGSTDQTAPLTLRLVREGRVVQSQLSSDGSFEFFINVASGEHPFIEVLDKANAIPSIAFPGRVTLNWQSAGNDHYVIREFVSSVWTDVGTVQDTGAGAFTFRTRWLEDDTTHSFRVVPFDAAGNEGTPLGFSFLEVRHPDAPAHSITYNPSTRRITISSA